jgi:ribonuclease HI
MYRCRYSRNASLPSRLVETPPANIWEDSYLHQKGNSKTWSPQPDNLGYTKVKDFMSDNFQIWNEPLIQQMFHPQEARKILQIAIVDKGQPDCLTWDGTTDGNYTVKAGYQAIMEWEDNSDVDRASTSNQNTDNWKNLWKLNIPPKCSHIIWRILNEAIPTKANLFKRSIRCDPLCPMCHNHLETTDHIFLQCEWAKLVWFASPLTINLNHDPATSIKDWLTYQLLHLDTDCLEKVSAILYGIWYARNNQVFHEKRIPEWEISHKALAHLAEYQTHNIQSFPQHHPVTIDQNSHNTSWSPPSRGILKMNVDAHLSSDGRWFSGLILRRSDGSIVGAATRSHSGTNDAIFGEAMGLVDAIEMIKRHDITEVIIEMDNQTIVNAVKKKASIKKPWGFAVNQCINFLHDNPNSSMSWVSRKGNWVAHELAKWAELDTIRDWPNSVPHCIYPHILKVMRDL